MAFDGIADHVKVLDQAHGAGWSLYNADSAEAMRGVPDASCQFSVHSPPFLAVYTFSDSPHDLSNTFDKATFFEHYAYIVRELLRVTVPGRLASVHVMQLPTTKSRDGFVGLYDFRGDVIRMFQREGWFYHSEVCVRKDPVVAMQRTKAVNLLHKQVLKDSAYCRQAVADYVCTFRRPGDNLEPVAGMLEKYHGGETTDADLDAKAAATWQPHRGRSLAEWKSILVWQRYAEPVWFDIDPSDVLSRAEARSEADERHISPLQLTVIRRCLQLWTNPGDVVFSPFAGIGSAGYVAVQMGRRFVGIELKDTYFNQAADNLRAAERSVGASLVDMIEGDDQCAT